jgi:siroheme synthase-like protein
LDGKLPGLRAAGAKIKRVRGFRLSDLRSVDLVICASNDPKLNRRVYQAASKRHIFCNVVDKPPLCSFIAPAIVRKGQIQIAISTGGRSPALAVRVKEEIARALGDEWGQLLDLITPLRRRVFARHPNDPAARSRVFQAMARGPALDLLRRGRKAEASRQLRAYLS